MKIKKLHTYPLDYLILFYYGLLGSGCKPVKKYDDKFYCSVSKNLFHKSLVRHLCKEGEPKLYSRIIKKTGIGRHVYSYCECLRMGDKKKKN